MKKRVLLVMLFLASGCFFPYAHPPVVCRPGYGCVIVRDLYTVDRVTYCPDWDEVCREQRGYAEGTYRAKVQRATEAERRAREAGWQNEMGTSPELTPPPVRE